MNRSPGAPAPPLRVLSLDGGGIRGKSSLLILENIMETIRQAKGLESVPRPCEYFDLIGGTSTGGIIAIMLGRLGMTVDQCIQAYDRVAQTAFTPKRTSFIPAAPRGAYSAQALEAAIKQTVKEFCVESPCIDQRHQGRSTVESCPHENAGFRSASCTKTAVLAITKDNVDAAPTLFTTYDTATNLSYRGCAIWEVARATSAATTFFKSIKVGRDNVEFIDAGFGHNNPCEVLIEEAQRQFPKHDGLQVLSIGTGLGDVVTIKDSRRAILKALAKMAATSTTVARRLHNQYGNSGHYHRFNVERGLQDITLSDWERTSTVSAHTGNYLHDNREAIQKNEHFVGRTEDLELLNEKLFGRRGHRRVCLYGLGGVGKTQVALRIAYEAKDVRGLIVLWLPAASNAAFQQACTEAVKRLAIQATKDEDAKELLQQYLKSDQARKWLLIIDNIDEMDILLGSPNQPGVDFFLPDSENGCILFTTRPYDIASRVADDNDIVELKEMSHVDARHYLEEKLQLCQIRDDGAASELLHQLAHLPLAITQAAAYMKRNKKPIREYLDLLRRTESDATDLISWEFYDRNRYKGSQNAVALTWQVSFKQICDLDATAAELLRFISRIEPKSIPRSMLPIEGSEIQLDDAIGTLLGYAFLDVRGDGETYDMHSLVHLATRTWVKTQAPEEKIAADAITHLEAVFPDDEWENRYVWRQYLPHALRALHEDDWRSEKSTDLGFWVGRCLFEDGRYKDAIRIFQDVVAQRDTLDEDDPDRLAAVHALAISYDANRQKPEAINLLEHVVKIEKTTLAEDHPDRLTSEHALAIAYTSQRSSKQLLKAVELLEHVVKVQKTTLAEDHPNRLTSEYALAKAYTSQRNSEQLLKAVELLEHVVKVRKTTLAEDHPDRLASEHALAIIAYRDQRSSKQLLKAVELLEHVVKIQKTTLAEDHPDRLTSEHELAIAYKDQGSNEQLLKAVGLLEHVVEVRKTTLAEDHPDRLLSEHTLATAYTSQRNSEQLLKAVELLEHVVKVRKTTLAEDHPSRLALEHELAIAYIDQGGEQVLKAIELLEHVVEAEKTTLAKDDPSRLSSEYWLAIAYIDQRGEQVPKAIELLEHVVKAKKTTLAKDDPSWLSLEYWLAIAYIDQRGEQVPKAIELLEHVVKAKKTTLAKDDPSRLSSEYWLAIAYIDQGGEQVPKAVELLEHVVEAEKTTLAKDDPSRLESEYWLAMAYIDQGGEQVPKAVKLLEHVVEAEKTTLAEDDPSRLLSEYWLAIAYINQGGGQILKAVKLLEHVVEAKKTTLAEDDPSRLESERALRMAYYTNGQVQEGIERLEHVVSVRRTTLAEDHFVRLRSEHALMKARTNCIMTTYDSWFEDMDW
ncbi:hypothetical protein FHL15_009886 [Xylaria flabelliformis]|uniref:PNPLA domain-containing protein n=1 Tax=Xylaria flabelliformis TaxID=2512241 RepID=A0A553HMK7_9PEZI|nr:hypothetical protein FHL15_009886 [Xylaria flabelliformis]